MTRDDDDDFFDDEPRSIPGLVVDVVACIVDVTWLVVFVGAVVMLAVWAVKL